MSLIAAWLHDTQEDPMRVEREWLRNVIFHADKLRRFTQDSPILPEVWLLAALNSASTRPRAWTGQGDSDLQSR
jgi:hypothetical protein